MKENLDKIYNKHLNNRYEKYLFIGFIIIYFPLYFIIIKLFNPYVFLVMVGIFTFLIGMIAVIIAIGRKYNIKSIAKFTNKYINTSNKKIDLAYKDIKKCLQDNKLLKMGYILELQKEYKKKNHFGTYLALLSIYITIASSYVNIMNMDLDMSTLVLLGIPILAIFIYCFIKVIYEIATNKDYFYYKTMNDILIKVLGDCNK